MGFYGHIIERELRYRPITYTLKPLFPSYMYNLPYVYLQTLPHFFLGNCLFFSPFVLSSFGLFIYCHRTDQCMSKGTSTLNRIQTSHGLTSSFTQAFISMLLESIFYCKNGKLYFYMVIFVSEFSGTSV